MDFDHKFFDSAICLEVLLLSLFGRHRSLGAMGLFPWVVGFDHSQVRLFIFELSVPVICPGCDIVFSSRPGCFDMKPFPERNLDSRNPLAFLEFNACLPVERWFSLIPFFSHSQEIVFAS